MAIMGSSKRPVFKPSVYETTRRRRRLPGWLVLLLVGIALGAGGVLFLQASYGPKRLTVAESQKLANDLSSQALENQRLQTKLDEVTRSRDTIQQQSEQTVNQLNAQVSKLEQQLAPLKEQISLFARTIPFDGRFGPININNANFFQENTGGDVTYNALLMQENATRPTFKGFVEFAFEGRHASGRYETITTPPIPVEFGHYDLIQGKAALPEGFVTRRVNAKLLAADGKRQVTLRIFTFK